MFKRILLAVLLLALTSFVIYSMASHWLTNASLSEKIDDYRAELASVKECLTEAQNSITEKRASLTNLQTELNSVTEALDYANAIINTLDGDTYKVELSVTEKEIDMLAKTVWGEARGCDKLQQSAVVWCVLNRVDDGQGTIAQVITAKDQFHGYSSTYPITGEIRELVRDVVTRWLIEKYTCGDVGRTLPSNYLYFSSSKTGNGNVFRTGYSGSYEIWDWSCWNPYK